MHRALSSARADPAIIIQIKSHVHISMSHKTIPQRYIHIFYAAYKTHTRRVEPVPVTKEPARHSLQHCSSLIARTTGRRPALAAQWLRGACWTPGTQAVRRTAIQAPNHRVRNCSHRDTGSCRPSMSCGQFAATPAALLQGLAQAELDAAAAAHARAGTPCPASTPLLAPCNWQRPAAG